MEEDSKDPSSAEPSLSNSEHHLAPSAASSFAAQEAMNKRRRGLGVVTPNACTECRKKRAKCDGQKPCARCKAQKDIECVYEVPVRQSKENLRHEIDQLRRQQRQSDHIFSALALAQPQVWEEFVTRLRNGQTVEGLSEWLGSTMPSGGGASHNNFGRHEHTPTTSLTLPSISGYGQASGRSPYASMGMSHAGPAQSQGGRQEYGQNSPWNYSSHSRSQTVSTRSGSHPDAMQWQSDVPPQNRVGNWVQDQSVGSRYQGLDQVLSPLDAPDLKVLAGSWTNVTGDSALVQHLLALYFCWEYPTFASLSKEHFLKDFFDGRNRYCSPILVNALLALGCRFSTKPNTRENANDPYTSGDHFFKESLNLLYLENNHHSLTTIQALGIMSIREASCGRDSESWYYAGQSVRMAIEMGLHRVNDDGDEVELAVKAATFWGAFALDHAWSLATGSLPQSSCFPLLPPKPAIIDDIEASLWIPYTDDGAPLQRSCEQPSNVRSVYKCFCELSELVHQSLYVLHSPGRPVTSRDLLNIYTQYLNWYDRIPEVLRLGYNFTPAVLFAHMYYHFAILLLFRPLIKLRIIGSSILPRDVCSQAADAITNLVRSYSQLYTLRRTPSFVPYFLLTSAIMHLAVGTYSPPAESPSLAEGSNASTTKFEDGETGHAHPPHAAAETPSPGSANTKLNQRVAEIINQGIADLTEMAPCHHFAEQALHILRYLARKWHIEVNIPLPANISREEAEKVDNLIRTSTSSLNFFVPNMVQEDFICTWGSRRQPSSGHDGDDLLGSITEPQPQTTGAVPHPPQPRSVGRNTSLGALQDLANADREEDTLPMEHVAGARSIAGTASSTDNILFWPFPMQGRPMLPSGPLLQDAGFALL